VLLCHVLARSAWAQTATMQEGTKSEIVALASIRLVVVVQLANFGAGTTGEGAALASSSLSRNELTHHCLWWRTRQVRALL
jgi:hypothetical protein